MRGDEARKLCAKAGVEMQLVQVPTSHGKADLTLYRQASKQARLPGPRASWAGRPRRAGGRTAEQPLLCTTAPATGCAVYVLRERPVARVC